MLYRFEKKNIEIATKKNHAQGVTDGPQEPIDTYTLLNKFLMSCSSDVSRKHLKSCIEKNEVDLEDGEV
jgi:hypothetical protein